VLFLTALFLAGDGTAALHIVETSGQQKLIIRQVCSRLWCRSFFDGRVILGVLSRRSIATCAAWAGLFLVLVGAPLFGAVPAGASEKDLADALRAGGYFIVLRHGATLPDQVEMEAVHPDTVSAQRQLNDKGKAQAKAFGDALRQIGVPVGAVYTSLLDRAYQTAVLAGFTNIEKTADLAESGAAVSPDEGSRRAEAFRKLLATPPKPGTNTVLVTHKPNIVDALGNDWSDVREGEASIFHPENGTAKLVARVQMDEWPRMVAAK
jgi:broad specificity phosphatase PhoE